MQDILLSVGKYFWLKVATAFGALATLEFFVVTDENAKVVTGLVFIVALDSLLGVAVAIMHKRFASWRMGQMMARKVILYAFALASVLILSSSNVGLFFWAPTYLGLFFVVSEVLSVLEKLALMGLNVPLGLLARINDVFDRLNKGDQNALKEIYRKEK